MVSTLTQLGRATRVRNARRFRLDSVSPGDTLGLNGDRRLAKLSAEGLERLSALHEMLVAQDRWGLLVMLQAMDAAGKDGAVKHVARGLDPNYASFTSFKAPTRIDLGQDYLRRHLARLPDRGMVALHNRSWYEEVLVVRVHPELLGNQKVPDELLTPDIWKERFEDINAIERYLIRNGIAVCKIFLHLSPEEQRKRFLSRLRRGDKLWKFHLSDVRDRHYWDDYQAAYQTMIRATSTSRAPWHVVPADSKRFARAATVAAIVDTLEGLGLAYPTVDAEAETAMREAAEALAREPSPRRT